jgi:ParB-like chromosome segregation protein Spo0J
VTPRTADPVWTGSAALRPFLVSIDSLEPFPGNPRRGNVEAVRASLARFGQVRPILVDGSRIVAGHHLVEAARAEGWTHVAAIANDFESDDEARAYLLADNRIAELGGHDQELLVAQLAALREADVALEGTGYTDADFEERLAELRRGYTPASPLAPTEQRQHRDPSMREVVLLYSPEQLKDFEAWAGIVGRELDVQGVSEIVYSALRRVASDL